MKKLLFVLPVVALTACETQEQSMLTGAAAGAALGAGVSGDDDKAVGAMTGALAGAAAGAYLGKANDPGQCYYKDAYGNRYIADCP